MSSKNKKGTKKAAAKESSVEEIEALLSDPKKREETHLKSINECVEVTKHREAWKEATEEEYDAPEVSDEYNFPEPLSVLLETQTIGREVNRLIGFETSGFVDERPLDEEKDKEPLEPVLASTVDSNELKTSKRLFRKQEGKYFPIYEFRSGRSSFEFKELRIDSELNEQIFKRNVTTIQETTKTSTVKKNDIVLKDCGNLPLLSLIKKDNTVVPNVFGRTVIHQSETLISNLDKPTDLSVLPIYIGLQSDENENTLMQTGLNDLYIGYIQLFISGSDEASAMSDKTTQDNPLISDADVERIFQRDELVDSFDEGQDDKDVRFELWNRLQLHITASEFQQFSIITDCSVESLITKEPEKNHKTLFNNIKTYCEEVEKINFIISRMLDNNNVEIEPPITPSDMQIFIATAYGVKPDEVAKAALLKYPQRFLALEYTLHKRAYDLVNKVPPNNVSIRREILEWLLGKSIDNLKFEGSIEPIISDVFDVQKNLDTFAAEYKQLLDEAKETKEQINKEMKENQIFKQYLKKLFDTNEDLDFLKGKTAINVRHLFLRLLRLIAKSIRYSDLKPQERREVYAMDLFDANVLDVDKEWLPRYAKNPYLDFLAYKLAGRVRDMEESYMTSIKPSEDDPSFLKVLDDLSRVLPSVNNARASRDIFNKRNKEVVPFFNDPEAKPRYKAALSVVGKFLNESFGGLESKNLKVEEFTKLQAYQSLLPWTYDIPFDEITSSSPPIIYNLENISNYDRVKLIQEEVELKGQIDEAFKKNDLWKKLERDLVEEQSSQVIPGGEKVLDGSQDEEDDDSDEKSSSDNTGSVKQSVGSSEEESENEELEKVAQSIPKKRQTLKDRVKQILTGVRDRYSRLLAALILSKKKDPDEVANDPVFYQTARNFNKSLIAMRGLLFVFEKEAIPENLYFSPDLVYQMLELDELMSALENLDDESVKVSTARLKNLIIKANMQSFEAEGEQGQLGGVTTVPIIPDDELTKLKLFLTWKRDKPEEIAEKIAMYSFAKDFESDQIKNAEKLENAGKKSPTKKIGFPPTKPAARAARAKHAKKALGRFYTTRVFRKVGKEIRSLYREVKTGTDEDKIKKKKLANIARLWDILKIAKTKPPLVKNQANDEKEASEEEEPEAGDGAKVKKSRTISLETALLNLANFFGQRDLAEWKYYPIAQDAQRQILPRLDALLEAIQSDFQEVEDQTVKLAISLLQSYIERIRSDIAEKENNAQNDDKKKTRASHRFTVQETKALMRLLSYLMDTTSIADNSDESSSDRSQSASELSDIEEELDELLEKQKKQRLPVTKPQTSEDLPQKTAPKDDEETVPLVNPAVFNRPPQVNVSLSSEDDEFKVTSNPVRQIDPVNINQKETPKTPTPQPNQQSTPGSPPKPAVSQPTPISNPEPLKKNVRFDIPIVDSTKPSSSPPKNPPAEKSTPIPKTPENVIPVQQAAPAPQKLLELENQLKELKANEKLRQQENEKLRKQLEELKKQKPPTPSNPVAIATTPPQVEEALEHKDTSIFFDDPNKKYEPVPNKIFKQAPKKTVMYDDSYFSEVVKCELRFFDENGNFEQSLKSSKNPTKYFYPADGNQSFIETSLVQFWYEKEIPKPWGPSTVVSKDSGKTWNTQTDFIKLPYTGQVQMVLHLKDGPSISKRVRYEIGKTLDEAQDHFLVHFYEDGSTSYFVGFKVLDFLYKTFIPEFVMMGRYED